MNILLIYPYCLEARIHDEDVSVPPMGLYSLGALLIESGHSAEVLNLSGMAGQPDRIGALLSERKPDMIGFSVLNANRWGAIEVARMARKIHPAVKVVFGGVTATCLWRHFLTHFPEVDFVVAGEGEGPLSGLVSHLETGAPPLESIPGLAFRSDGNPMIHPPGEPIRELDRLPNPARHFTYRHLSLARGCPHQCAFCGSPGFWGRRGRFHSAGYFVDQMELLSQKGVNFFYVSDDVFTLKPDLTIAVCKEILRRKLSVAWAAISRVDQVNESMLRWMRLAGCVQISFGIESGSEKIRKALNKRIDPDQARRAFELTTRYGILPRAYFIYGSPGETDATIAETLAMMDDIRPLGAIFYMLALFPGAGLYEAVKKQVGWTDDIWLDRMEDILYFQVDPSLSAEAVMAFGKTLRDGFHNRLPGYMEQIEVADDPELAPCHADFFSRLGMTFSHGDYAAVAEIPNKDETAGRLFERALTFAPDHRAYLGLGILRQKARRYRASEAILEEGLAKFPKSRELRECLGVSRGNLRE